MLLDSTIVGAALPDMEQRLHIRLTGLQWIVDAYVLLVATLLLCGGVFADRVGRKRVFLAGVAVFTAGSALCAVAPSIGRLITGRVIQGIGAAAMSPASPALLSAAHPVPRGRVRAIGLWAGLSGIGLAAGPPAGGILTQAFGWPAIFLVNVPIGVILLLTALRALGESRNPSAAIQAVGPQKGGLASGISSTTRQIGAVLGVAVLGAVVRTRESGGASVEAGLDGAFIAAGAVTLAGAVFTGLRLTRSTPANVAAQQQPQPTDPPAITTPC